MSGQQQDWHFMSGEAKINKHTWASSSISALVSRCSYGLHFTGPAVAIDTGESSGLIASDAAVRALREGACQTAFASSASWISNPYELITLCAAGFISKSGQTRVFDETSDGYTKGEGVVTLLLRRHKDELKDQDLRAVPDARGLILGSGVNNKGQSSSLGSPSGPAIQDVIGRASRDANSPIFLMDTIEASASGDKLSDQMELMAVASLRCK
ncbi:pikAII [Symbiodinium natans]|uniref:PikAII protein n=1 Tax=Symbiodinium natans TaxID=878477 RepID=A0A812RXX9_9DINO|nr:pikAII [Symbiodinium natans]